MLNKDKDKDRRPESPNITKSRSEYQFDQGDPKKVFELIEKIGSGSYGDVYKSRMVANGQLAAVKVILLEPGENLDDVMIEVNMLKACHHSNIVSYFGCFFKSGIGKSNSDSIWIAMEYCGGGSVEAVYKSLGTPYSENEIACVMRDCLQGIAYLHESKKIHRDIKGGNLLFTEEGRVKLADFGVSAQLTRTLKKRQTVIGSPYWMAPEVITAEDHSTLYDEKADIWSIGITSIEMAECAPPLYDLHPMRALFMIPKNKAPVLAKKAKWSKEFHDFVSQTVNKNTKKRADAKTMLNHPFVTGAKNSKATIQEIIERYISGRNKGERDDNSDNEEPPTPMESQSTMKNGERETEESLVSMGFPRELIKQAIQLFATDVEKAANWIIQQTSEDVTRDHQLAHQLSETLKIASQSSLSQVDEDRDQIESDEMLARKLSQEALKSPQESTFKAQKLCRIKKTISCGDYWEKEQALVVGMEDGLVWIKAESDQGKQRLAGLSSRNYLRIHIIEEIDALVSISGKMGSVCVSDLRVMDPSKRGSKRFETETRLKKIKDSKGSDFFQVANIDREIYLLVAKPISLLITKWAEHPFNKFMKVREITFDKEYICANLHQLTGGEPRVCVGFVSGFQIIDIDGGTAADIIVDQAVEDLKGQPVASLSLPTPDTIMLFFEGCGCPIKMNGDPAGKTIKWKTKIHHAISVGESFVTLSQEFTVDIWSAVTFSLLHTFNNSSPIFPLRLNKNNRVLFASIEQKNDQTSTSVISILNQKP